MDKWELVYCFSKYLSDDDKNFNTILYSLKKSIEFNSKFHKLKLYTDDFTYEFVKHIDIEIKVINYSDFRFLDDIKIQTLPLLNENEVLIDPDIFLYNELNIDEDCDLILERPEKITDNWYKEDYEEAKSFKFSNLINFSSKIGNVGNIGIIKFFNKEFMNTYISHYNYIKKTAHEEYDLLPPFPKFSVLLGQLSLQNLVDRYNYKVKYCKFNKKNKYSHLSGYRKYVDSEFIDKMIGIDKNVI